MATKIVSTDVVGNVKPSFASSSLVGLTVRANGEEPTKVLDMSGNMVDAQIPAPANPPFVQNNGGASYATFDGATPGKIVTVNDGVVFAGGLSVYSATAAFSPADVGHQIDVGIGTNIMTTFHSATEMGVSTPFIAAASAIPLLIHGRPDKVVLSRFAEFAAADVGRAVKVNGVNDVIASVDSIQQIKVTTNDLASLDHQDLIIYGRPESQRWAAYAFVWAATQRYPLVENDATFGGSLAPRGPGSPVTTLQIDENNYDVTIYCNAPPSNRPDLDQVWMFRTAFFDTEEEARLQAEAGLLFFIAAVDAVTDDNTAYRDTNSVEGTDQIELDNFGVPTFRFVIYSDPYWWGWGNFPLSVEGEWVVDQSYITITDGTKWFPGRNGQYVRLQDVETGGVGNQGLWIFKYIDSTHAQLTLADGTIVNSPISGTGKIVVQGPPTTLYRSKPRNPFSWGYTEILADGSRVPQVFALKIGGGLGTAIAEIPTVPYLLLSTEYPAGTYTLNLTNADNVGDLKASSFANTLRKISNFYSISSHFSQFVATRQYFPTSGSQMRTEKIVLWGWDAKNFCIVETDGIGINIVSEKISKTLRRISKNRSKQLLAHGAYDARNRMNCMWLPAEDSDMQCNLLIMHHAPTDQWFIHDDLDVLCSSQFQDGDTNLSKIFVGTETGLMGEAFADGFFANWVSSGSSVGTLTQFTTNSFTRDDGGSFYLDRDGYVGNWCLITDPYGEHEQWGRISAVTAKTLTFDYIIPSKEIIPPFGGSIDKTKFNPALVPGSIFYVGMIECRALKYFNLNAPAEDKKLDEIWLTIDQTDTSFIVGHTGSTFLRYYRERSGLPFAPRVDGRIAIPIVRVSLDDHAPTNVWFTQEPPTERIKAFGLEIVDRSFGPWRLYDYTLKVS